MSTQLDFSRALGVQMGNVTPIPGPEMSKADQELLQSNAIEAESTDSFTEWYGQNKSVRAIRPPYNLDYLSALCHQNNTLGQCIAAMEVNIDGTGYGIDPADGKQESTEDDTRIAALKDFFDEPYPGLSFIVFRRKLRRDMEKLGNGYIEIIRNVKGEVIFMNYLDARTIRLIQYDDPVAVTKKIMRMGKEQTLKLMTRERRFIQSVGKTMVFFREFNASRDLDKVTGSWVGAGGDKANKSTEIIHLTIDKDTLTPYGIPRWITQVPSVLGSRRAEELNLEFFDSGGLPPALIIVSGGSLSPDNRTAITNYLSGKAKHKQRGIIVETFSTGGTVANPGSTNITVERFGSEKQNDSMFEKYDERCFERVRGAFRIPPMFLGRSQDYNFATAYTAYMVAEAQVFQPEREEFDSMVNMLLMPELDKSREYLFRSLPMSVKDVQTQLKAIEMAKDLLDPYGMIDALNEVTDMSLKVREDMEEVQDRKEAMAAIMTQRLSGVSGKEKPAEPVEPDDDEENDDEETAKGYGKIAKMDESVLQDLADDWAKHLSGDVAYEDASVKVMKQLISGMKPALRKLFTGYVAMRMLPEHSNDFDGTSELISCAGECDH